MTYLKKIVPTSIKAFIQNLEFYSTIDSRRLAASSKRLDICSSQFAHLLHLMGAPSLSGKVCLEIGSGWVLTHSLVCYLLGAKKVIATDIRSNARLGNLNIAVNSSILSLIRDILSSFEEHSKIRERLDILSGIKKFDSQVLENLGIFYVAPLNITTGAEFENIDFIHSHSVLEHVPCEDVFPLTENLNRMLASGGIQAHCIHLEDHLDINQNPFSFLSCDSASYSRELESRRGNRIRSEEWINIFNKLEGVEVNVLYKWSRNNKDLPKRIDASINYKNREDLKVSHLGITSKKV